MEFISQNISTNSKVLLWIVIFYYFVSTFLFVGKDVIIKVFETNYFDLKILRKVTYKIYI